MTKSKSSMVTRGITNLATDILPVLVMQSVFSLLPLDRYLLPITTPSRYQPTDISEKLLYTTISRYATFIRCRMSPVTILLWIWSWFTEWRRGSILVSNTRGGWVAGSSPFTVMTVNSVKHLGKIPLAPSAISHTRMLINQYNVQA